MEEVLKKAEAEAEHLEEKAVQIGVEAAKNKMSIAFINCTIWVGYGFFKEQRDWPIVFANLPGIIFGLTAAITARL